jgi:hypothetical protein
MTVSVKVNFHIGDDVVASDDDVRGLLRGVQELSGMSQIRTDFISSGQIVSQALTVSDSHQFSIETVFADQAAQIAFEAATVEARATAFEGYTKRGWVIYTVDPVI